MAEERTPEQVEADKRRLVIEVLDKGLLTIGEAGMLARLLSSSGSDVKCGCKDVCDGCRGRCGGCLERVLPE